MKRLLLHLSILGVASTSYAAFSVNLDAGELKGFNGALTMQADNASPHSNGSLLLLIAAGGDSSFSNSLAPGQFVSGNDVILGAGGFDTNANPGPNETLTSFSGLSGNDNDLIALRWFPQITYAQYLANVTPIAGQNFGTYNPLTANNPNNNPDGGNLWQVPTGNSGLISLDFFTSDTTLGGSQTPDKGYANSTVGLAAVPEPSTYVSAALAAIGTLFVRRKFAVKKG